MARTPTIQESKLTKMEIRKLNALRNSVGDVIAAKAFRQWLKERPTPTGAFGHSDTTAKAIANAIMDLIEGGKIKKLPRGGYVLKRGRGRVVVTPVA